MAEAETSATATETNTAPLLRPRQEEAAGAQPTTLAVLLGRATGRRGASMLVRETAARQLEERRADWGYSKPVVALDMMWNLAFVVVSLVMLICTVKERPNVPVRIWICGYALQCLVHVVLVWVEYRRRNRRRFRDEEAAAQPDTHSNVNDSEDEDTVGLLGVNSRSSVTKRCESVNTMASFLWWIVGFYWVVSGGEILFYSARRLYWKVRQTQILVSSQNTDFKSLAVGKSLVLEQVEWFLLKLVDTWLMSVFFYLRMRNVVYVSAHMRMGQTFILFPAIIISILDAL